jgi:hypothetical protein
MRLADLRRIDSSHANFQPPSVLRSNGQRITIRDMFDPGHESLGGIRARPGCERRDDACECGQERCRERVE